MRIPTSSIILFLLAVAALVWGVLDLVDLKDQKRTTATKSIDLTIGAVPGVNVLRDAVHDQAEEMRRGLCASNCKHDEQNCLALAKNGLMTGCGQARWQCEHECRVGNIGNDGGAHL